MDTNKHELDEEEMILESVSLKVADDAVPVCLDCFEPCNPLDNYCPSCGSNDPINPLASYMPFVDLRFKVGMIYKLWRKIWDSSTASWIRALYACVFLLFIGSSMPILFLVVFSLVIFEKLKLSKK